MSSTFDQNIGHATAYGYYRAGYTGSDPMTEEEFTEAMGEVGTAAETAVEAKIAAQAAQAAAEAAQTGAQTARSGAETARSGAETAQTGAAAARTAAEQAQAAAETAQGKAESAQDAAESAQATAENAQTAAESAQTAAESAQTAAETAQGKAEDAQEAAETAAAGIEASAAQIEQNTEAISSLNGALSYIEDAVFDNASGIVHNADSAYSYSNGLNNAYVWIYDGAYLPKGSTPKITIYGKTSSRVGAVTIYFLKKNPNNTYSVVDSVSLTTVVGTNVVTIPSGITDNNDIYVGFYSTASGVAYNSSGDRAQSSTRFSYASPMPEQITPSGSYTMDFNAKITYTLKSDNIEVLQNRVSALESKQMVIVDASGNGDYETILEAITSEPENTVILVRPGVYEQDMTACLKKRIILIGTDRNQCVIRDTDGRYGHHPLYISCGYFENLTIEAPYISGTSQEIGVSDLGAYAVHIDTDDDYAIGKQCEFYHCNISSDFFPAVGLGMRKNATYIFDDCVLSNGQIANRGDYSDEGTLGALYFHDSNGEQGNQYIKVKDCVLKSKLSYAMCMYEVSRTPQNNRVYCEFINNVLFSEVGQFTDTVWFRNDPLSGIFSIDIGFGNSISSLNN